MTCLWPQLFLQVCGEELIENRKPLPSACEREFITRTSIRQEVCCTSQFPALQIQMKDVSTGYKFPTLHTHRKFVRCPQLRHHVSVTPLAWYWAPSFICAPKAGTGWTAFLGSNLFQSRSYICGSLSNFICSSDVVAALFAFNHSWRQTLFFYVPWLLQEGLPSHLFRFWALVQGWHGWDGETRQKRYIFLLQASSSKKKKK